MPHARRYAAAAPATGAVAAAVAIAVAAMMMAGCSGTGAAPQEPDPSAITTPGTAGTTPPPAAGTTAPATAPASAAATSSPSEVTLARLTVERTGGLAGFQDALTVNPDGSWIFEGERSGTTRGQLTAEQRGELARLLAAPAFAVEAQRDVPPGACNDALVYTLRAGGLVVRYDDCPGDGNRPAIAAVVSFVVSATAM